jgi:hypothetical protein
MSLIAYGSNESSSRINANIVVVQNKLIMKTDGNILLKESIGTPGQVIKATGETVVWDNTVNEIDTGSTGLIATPNSEGVVSISGVLNPANGGTGMSVLNTPTYITGSTNNAVITTPNASIQVGSSLVHLRSTVSSYDGHGSVVLNATGVVYTLGVYATFQIDCSQLNVLTPGSFVPWPSNSSPVMFVPCHLNGINPGYDTFGNANLTNPSIITFLITSSSMFQPVNFTFTYAYSF